MFCFNEESTAVISADDFVRLTFTDPDDNSKTYSKRYHKKEIEPHRVLAGMCGLSGFPALGGPLPFSEYLLRYCLRVNASSWTMMDWGKYPETNLIKLYFPEVASKLFLNHSAIRQFLQEEMTAENVLRNTSSFSPYFMWQNDVYRFRIIVAYPKDSVDFTYIAFTTCDVTSGHYSVPLVPLQMTREKYKELTDTMVYEIVRTTFLEYLDKIEETNTHLGDVLWSHDPSS